MIAATALQALAARIGTATGHPAELGDGNGAAALAVRILVQALTPVPDVSKMSGRHLADQATTLSWVMLLLLRSEATDLLEAVRHIEAAAADIEARPVLGGEGWRADLLLEDAPEWARGQGAAIGIRMRVGVA